MARYVQGPEGVQIIQDDPRYMLPPGAEQIYTNQNVPGGPFQNLLNQVTGGINANRQLLGKAARYAPGAGRTVEELQQGDILGTLGSVGGMYAAGQAAKTLGAKIPATGLPGMLAKGALYAGGSLLGSNLGAGIASGLGQMFGGAAQAVTGAGQNVTGAIAGQRREEGKSGLTGEGVGYSNADVARLAEINEIMRKGGVTTAQQMLPLYQQYRGVDLQNQMQLNQQLGQLTGALNKQKYIAELASGAQAETGATTRTMMTAPNPYAGSAFQYRG